MSPRAVRPLALLCGLFGLSSAVSAQCARWASGFDSYGGGLDVRAIAVHDDGTGPAVYAGGVFEIVRFGAGGPEPLGGGISGTVEALAVFDDGSGPALYAAGDFDDAGGVPAANIARWDGVAWTPLGSGLDDRARALRVHDDGSGPALYVGGRFSTAGGVSADRVARWDGAAWTALGGSVGLLGHEVLALEAYDDGSGPALYAGCALSGGGANGIARWDGAGWSALGPGTNGNVNALAVFDDGGGPALFVGGDFSTAGPGPARALARWDGGWSATSFSAITGDSVRELAVHDDGSGPALVVASWTFGDDLVSRYDGSSWTTLASLPGAGGQKVHALASVDVGAGPRLHLGGTFTEVEGVRARTIARRDGSTWSPLATGVGISGLVNALATHDDGGGEALYAAGNFSIAGTVDVSAIARFDGSAWSPLDATLISGGFRALASFDDGGGPALFAGGDSPTLGLDPTTAGVLRWDGAGWSTAGTGIQGPVYALEPHDDGTGPALYAGGLFQGGGLNRIARWDGNTWSVVGGGVRFNHAVQALEAFDEGQGARLFAGGRFSAIDSQLTMRIARWDGSLWTAVGGGLSGGDVHALAVYDGGSGPALYAGGTFTAAGGQPAAYVVRWNGAAWAAVGYPGTDVLALATFDDGSGTALYTGTGWRFDGTSWARFGEAAPYPGVLAFAPFAPAAGAPPALYAAGMLKVAGGLPSCGFGRWERCAIPPVAFCAGDGGAASCPCTSGAVGHGCANSADASGALLSATGTSVPDTLVLRSEFEPATALSIFLQGDAQLASHTAFGDGLRCVGGNLKRLYVANATGGVVSAPAAGDASISQRSAALGDPLAPGATRHYQVWYRDPDPTFCPAPAGATFNVGNGLSIVW